MNLPNMTPVSTALIVDDDEFSQAVAKRLLNNFGFNQCEAALDGVEGLRILAGMARPPGLILCDVFMPNKDGIEFIQALAKLNYQGKLILMSGGDPMMMGITEQIAISNGIKVIAKFAKPLDNELFMLALGQSAI